MPEEPDDPLDGFFHAVEPGECRIGAHGPVQEDTAKAGILGRVDHLGLTDRRQEPFGRIGISHRISAARFQILRHRHIAFAAGLEGPGESVEQRIVVHDPSPRLVGCIAGTLVILLHHRSAICHDRESASAHEPIGHASDSVTQCNSCARAVAIDKKQHEFCKMLPCRNIRIFTGSGPVRIKR